MHLQLHPGWAGCGIGHAPPASITTPLGLVCAVWGPECFSRTLQLWGALDVPGHWANRQEVSVAGTSGLHFRAGSGPEDQLLCPGAWHPHLGRV